MSTYVLRRILLMIPTLFGISMVVWLVMFLSPGRPGAKKSQGALGEASDLGKDSLKLASENEAQRIFRRQFGLDRPGFVNLWWKNLTPAYLREEVRVASAPIGEVGPTRKREARERLEDYGYYSVPALVELLAKTEGAEQDEIRFWLGRNSLRLPLKRTGEDIDESTARRHEEWTAENVVLTTWTWAPDAPPEERAKTVAKWTEWYEANRDRWELSTGEKIKRTLTDTQFGTYWGRLIRGDFGSSHHYKQPVISLVLDRMKYSLALNCTALLIAYLIAVPVGIYGAYRQGGIGDRLVSLVLFALYSLPNFFVGTLLIRWFTADGALKFFPVGGFEGEYASSLNTWEHLKDIAWHITLPLICLTYVSLAVISRYARTGMLDVIRSDYVRTARAKGLSEFTVVFKHVMRNGILPIVTILGTSLPILIGGSIAIEYIFNINGMGLLMIQSIFNKDFNVVMGVQLIVGVLTMVGILIADIAYAMLDPRISLS